MTSTTSHLYRFIRDSVIPKGTIKLVVTLGESPRTITMTVDFLTVKFPLAFNGVLARPLLKALKAVTSIQCLIMKFPIATGIGQVRGRQRDSSEYDSR